MSEDVRIGYHEKAGGDGSADRDTRMNSRSIAKRAKGLLALLLIAIPLFVAAAVSTSRPPGIGDPRPSPALDPGEVVRIQIAALQTNSLLNEGIELTYRFASPANKRATGPLPRFVEMVRSPPYDRLLNHRSARYSPVLVSGNEALQVVIITDRNGEEFAYHWLLSRQDQGELKDCWMTNAVIPAPPPAQHEFVQAPPTPSTWPIASAPYPIAARNRSNEEIVSHAVRVHTAGTNTYRSGPMKKMPRIQNGDSRRGGDQ